MKKIMSLFLVFVLILTPVITLASDVSSVTWGMSTEEVKSIMGEADNVEQVASPSFGTVEILNYYHQSVSSFDEVILAFICVQDTYLSKVYLLSDDASLNKCAYLEKALQSKYGDKTQEAELFVLFADMIGMGSFTPEEISSAAERLQLATWKLEDNSSIVLFNFNSNTFLGYMAPEEMLKNVIPVFDDSGL